MAKVTTVQDMFNFLEQLIHDGKAHYPIYFDTDARTFEYHMAKVGSAYTLDPEDLGEGFEMVTLHEERS